MKYFKLELKNREENFNKTFGNQPRVGTLNPLQARKRAPRSLTPQPAPGTRARPARTSAHHQPALC
eukprot:6870329-Prymnesium_polylepis.1